MKLVNDSINSPLRYITDSGRVIGQFYLARDRSYHLAEYVPYERLPSRYLCGEACNFFVVGSRESSADRNRCPKCWEILRGISQEDRDEHQLQQSKTAGKRTDSLEHADPTGF